MKRIIKVFLIGLLSVFLLACNKNMSYKFDVSTGDSIVVKLNMNSGYMLEQEDGTFSVSDAEADVILQGFFVNEEMHNTYLDVVKTSEAVVIEEEKGNGCSYLQYQLVSDTHTENNFICWIDGSNTGVVIASVSDKIDAENAFELLSFSINK